MLGQNDIQFPYVLHSPKGVLIPIWTEVTIKTIERMDFKNELCLINGSIILYI